MYKLCLGQTKKYNWQHIQAFFVKIILLLFSGSIWATDKSVLGTNFEMSFEGSKQVLKWTC